jgi:hypothetical protein
MCGIAGLFDPALAGDREGLLAVSGYLPRRHTSCENSAPLSALIWQSIVKLLQSSHVKVPTDTGFYCHQQPGVWRRRNPSIERLASSCRSGLLR